ncbi:enoyl-CoA hydratase/isomerase family protein [Halioglobus japonicus]|uniref:Gamma-carboxygeranoyl-CoA hydratase n=1 Tax=Halioglobus japonicus TaxID=930805 RepID=A0AAP8MBS2_9GAMM|nr:enoyl-CoA hydratase/isomerase family protein [Halioglobus japonicus]PLW84880.1 gamma-carboxygeranoyl-CoA hydratase [Halioglobus japonicus]
MDTVSTTIDERGVATVTLNRPDKHNAFDDVVIAELRAAFDALAANDTVRVVVLASEGKSFSAGADLGWMKRMAAYDYSDNLADARLLADMLKALYDMPQPTIARVQGAAFGGAVGLVSCCDMAVASERASFSLSEAKIGLIPATISPYVIKAIGERAARRYFTTAERFQAAQALHLGLISELASDNELDNVLNSLISALLQNGPLAVREAKKLVHDVAGQPITPAFVEGTCEAIARIRISEEGQEGLGAFLNKRQPRWIAGE